MDQTILGKFVDPAVYAAQEERGLISQHLGRAGGTFVEVGAYDAVFQSQTHHLELIGWNGLLVEPVPEFADNLRRSRRAAVRQCACVSPEMAVAERVAMLERRGNSTTRFDPRKVRPDENVIEVPAATLDSILEDAGISHVDFLSVDVEGAEPEVLKGFDLMRFRPRLVLVDDRERFGETCRVLRGSNFRLMRRTGHNAWFVPAESGFAPSTRGRAQLAWTYGIGRFLRRRTRPRSGAHRLSSRPD
ncbi:FkbM family methyltransferase [Xanthobacter sp. KR7-65]|uniref:FkbM family methyltransferase n=1 Tax=Xanthobacter sp. KR7-65 TaxID=3156612 RepID=UPI0032B61637